MEDNPGTKEIPEPSLKLKLPRREFTLFTYSIAHFLNKDRVHFFYELKGRKERNKIGIFTKYKMHRIGRTALLVPTEYEKETEEFFRKWKCNYTKNRVVVKE